MSHNPLFYAKILLFGEYGIIKDSMGLSIPFNFYQGTLKFGKEEKAQKSTASLKAFANHLEELQQKGKLGEALDLKEFQADIDNGLYFDSSIPQGFGVGSSGALCAAVYDRYAIEKISPTEINRETIARLKRFFGELEGFFHGKSSGIDPLICYLNLPLLIKSKDEMGTVDLPLENAGGKGAIFLLNTGQPGETQPMVSIFMEKMKSQGFRKMLKNQFKEYNDACIQAFLKGEIKTLFSNIKELSNLALDHFSQMIPTHFHQPWRKGIESGAYYLKLCGSGGGGYMLGFTEDFAKAEPMLKSYKPEIIYRF